MTRPPRHRWGSQIRARHLLTAVAITVLGVSSALPASAHPLGNFSINHYNGITVAPDHISVDHVLDMAEIPTFSERSRIDIDGDGEVIAQELDAYAAVACQETATLLEATVESQRVGLVVRSASASLKTGQGAETLRRECSLRGALVGSVSDIDALRFEFRDPSFAERRGWREIVVVGDGVTIAASDAPNASTSARLTLFPAGLDADLLVQPAAAWTAVPGAVTGVRETRSEGPTGPAGIATEGSNAGELDADLAALVNPDELTLPAVLLALVIAVVLGAAHALSPGHGKTVMAAYLVGTKGSIRMALALGLMVTVSHTLGVLVLALVSVWASTLVPLERLYPVLGLASGAIIIALGAWLLRDRIRTIQVSRSPAVTLPEHAASHHHDHAHEGSHEQGNAGPDAPHRQPVGDGQGVGHGATDEGGWHSHGLGRHRHTLPADARPGWRGLAALGLAGGLVPSVSALILLLASISAGRPEFGIVLTIAFGAGMAAVLVGIGVALVWGRGLLQRRTIRVMPNAGPWLPTAAAAFVLLAGVTMMGQAALALSAI